MQNGSVNFGAVEVAHPVYPVAVSPEQIEALKEAVMPMMAMPAMKMTTVSNIVSKPR